MRSVAKAKHRSEESRARPSRDRLAPALQLFLQGDYVRARPELDRVAAEEAATDSERATARELAAATRMDPGTLLVNLACLGLFVLASGLTALFQP